RLGSHFCAHAGVPRLFIAKAVIRTSNPVLSFDIFIFVFRPRRTRLFSLPSLAMSTTNPADARPSYQLFENPILRCSRCTEPPHVYTRKKLWFYPSEPRLNAEPQRVQPVDGSPDTSS